MGGPDVFVEPRPGCVAGSADALEAGFIPTLVYSPALGDGALQTGGIGAENDFCSSVDVAIGE